MASNQETRPSSLERNRAKARERLDKLLADTLRPTLRGEVSLIMHIKDGGIIGFRTKVEEFEMGS